MLVYQRVHENGSVPSPLQGGKSAAAPPECCRLPRDPQPLAPWSGRQCHLTEARKMGNGVWAGDEKEDQAIHVVVCI
jgi:hypothetical protein